jgi:hypothetical protein
MSAPFFIFVHSDFQVNHPSNTGIYDFLESRILCLYDFNFNIFPSYDSGVQLSAAGKKIIL